MTLRHTLTEQRTIDDQYIIPGVTILWWTPRVINDWVEIDNPETAFEYAKRRFKEHTDHFFLPLMEKIIAQQAEQQKTIIREQLQEAYHNNTNSTVTSFEE